MILWPDTFNNHFHPETGQAAVEVLEAAGYQVWMPAESLCCGRPLYDFGMLDTAKSLLREILKTLRPQIQAGIPVVGLEPSCMAVFRDELTNLFPDDEDAKRLHDQSFLLSEFLNKKVEGYKPPRLLRKALGPRALPSQIDHGHGRRDGAAEEDGPRLRHAGAGLLRNGRILRVRERPALRRSAGLRRACVCCLPCAGRRRHAHHRQRLQLPAADRPDYPTSPAASGSSFANGTSPPERFLMSTESVECVIEAEAIVGESPVWSVREQALYWVDITGQKIHRFHPSNGGNDTFQLPQPVTCVALHKAVGW